MIASVNRTLFRRSWTLKMFFRLVSTGSLLLCAGAGGGLAVREVVALGGRTSVAPRQGQDLDTTAGGGDGCLRGLRERVGLHGDGAGDLTPAQHLHEGTLVGEPLAVQHLGIDGVQAGGLEHVEVQGLVLDPEGVVEATELRDPHGEGQLTALEADGDGATGGLALGATAGRLATLAADAPADALAALVRARSGLEIVDLHGVSSTPRRPRRSRRPLRPSPGAGPGRSCRGSRDGPEGCWSCRFHADRAPGGCHGASAWSRWT